MSNVYRSNRTHEYATAGFGPMSAAGTDIGEVSTMEEGLAKAGLDFEVAKSPAHFTTDAGEVMDVPGKAFTYRTDTKAPLGLVSDDYQIYQQRQAFGAAEIMFYEDRVRFSSGGVYNGGEKVWLCAELPNMSIEQIDGSTDVQKRFLFFSNGHGGRHPIAMSLLAGRVSCDNMLNGIMKGIQTEFKFRHIGNGLDERIAEAQATLLKAEGEFEKVRDLFQGMARERMTGAEFRAFATILLDDVKGKLGSKKARDSEKSRAALIDELTEYFEGGNEGAGSTIYGGFQTITAWRDHKVARLDESQRNRAAYERGLASMMDGEDKRTKTKALRLLTR